MVAVKLLITYSLIKDANDKTAGNTVFISLSLPYANVGHTKQIFKCM